MLLIPVKLIGWNILHLLLERLGIFMQIFDMKTGSLVMPLMRICCFTGWICTMGSCKSEKSPWDNGWIPISQASTWSFLCSSCSTLAAQILFHIIFPKVSISVLSNIRSHLFAVNTSRCQLCNTLWFRKTVNWIHDTYLAMGSKKKISWAAIFGFMKKPT